MSPLTFQVREAENSVQFIRIHQLVRVSLREKQSKHQQTFKKKNKKKGEGKKAKENDGKVVS